MKNTFLTTIVFAVCSIFPFVTKAISTGEIIGQVIEHETRKPVAFAEVIFENNMDKIVVTANEYGFYYAQHLPTGKYQMRVVFNNHTFLMNKVRVYDSYSNEINFIVSNNDRLPGTVEVIKKEPVLTALAPNDIRITNTNFGDKGSRNLSDVLVSEPNLDVRDGKLYVKGSDQVKFFIDGTPVMAPPVLDRIW